MTDGGSVIAMSYYGAEKVVPRYNVMAIAKAALENIVRYLAAPAPILLGYMAASAAPRRASSDWCIPSSATPIDTETLSVSTSRSDRFSAATASRVRSAIASAWPDTGVDVLGCVAGPTSTPGYWSSKPASLGLLAPPLQRPDEASTGP